MNTKLRVIYFSFCLLIIGVGCQTSNKTPEKTNILFLLADDMGYGELGSYGQKVIKTPVLDELANQGMRFTDFYAGTSVCSPSRAVLMTGKHAGHATIRGNSGIYENDVWKRVPLKKDETTLGEMMQEAGYQTGFIGKWHLGNPNDESTWAMSRGFDFAVQEQWASRFGGREFDERVHWVNDDRDTIRYEQDKYDCIDVFRTNFAMDFLDRKDDTKPFFLFMSYRIPHGHERYIRNKELYADKGWTEKERSHAAKITLLDGQIGRLLKRLEDDGELDNTLVLFTSDNGAHHEGHDHLFFESTGGLRGFKRDMYEGGIRTPLIAVWKDKIKPGITSSHQGAFYDFMPTFAEVAGIASPDKDGISIIPELTGKEQLMHDYLYWELQLDGWFRTMPLGGFRQAIRKGDWKAVRYGSESKTELYNLIDDINETNDVAVDNPEIVTDMNTLFIEARTETEGFPFGGKVQDYKAKDKIKYTSDQ